VLEADVTLLESSTIPPQDAILGLMPSKFITNGFPVSSGLTQDLNRKWNFLMFSLTMDSPVRS
jgi:hypothetical protein